MSTSTPSQTSGRPDIIILILFIIATLAGFASIYFNSSNALAYLQFLFTVGGLLIKIVQVRPEFIKKVTEYMSKGQPNVSRTISTLLLLVVIFLQIMLFIGPKQVTPIIPAPTPTPLISIQTPPASSPSPTKFSVSTIALASGTQLPIVEPITIPAQGVPLTITGTYSPQGSGQVWAIVEDAYGQYYLQISPAQLDQGGQWTIAGINTAKGTTKIDFVYVTPQGSTIFDFMKDAKAFGAFTKLPNGSLKLKTLNIRVV